MGSNEWAGKMGQMIEAGTQTRKDRSVQVDIRGRSMNAQWAQLRPPF